MTHAHRNLGRRCNDFDPNVVTFRSDRKRVTNDRAERLRKPLGIAVHDHRQARPYHLKMQPARVYRCTQGFECHMIAKCVAEDPQEGFLVDARRKTLRRRWVRRTRTVRDGHRGDREGIAIGRRNVHAVT